MRIHYDFDKDEAITRAKNDYIFFGKSADEVEEQYGIPRDILGELIFVGDNCWRAIRAKVEEDELDGLINTNLYNMKQALNSVVSKVREFLEKDAAITSWEEADAAMKVIGILTKAAETSRKLQESREPKKMKKLGEAIPGLEDEAEEVEDGFVDEYAKPSKDSELESEEAEELENAMSDKFI